MSRLQIRFANPQLNGRGYPIRTDERLITVAEVQAQCNRPLYQPSIKINLLSYSSYCISSYFVPFLYSGIYKLESMNDNLDKGELG